MTIAEKVLNKLTRLPENQQREVLDFVEFLETKTSETPASGELGDLRRRMEESVKTPLDESEADKISVKIKKQVRRDFR